MFLALVFSFFLFIIMLISVGLLILNPQKFLWVEVELFMSYNDCSPIMFLAFLDYMSLSFIGVVSLISSVVFMYSASYMSEDLNKTNFMKLVLLFVFSMFLMILSPNLISILVGWDGLGLVSYVLVIYFQNPKSYAAGMITFMSNRVGDVLIIISISWCMTFGSFDFFTLSLLMSSSECLSVLFLLMLAAMTKSAQIPFSSWLPAAMAAPTPVSSLVHSSTLVTAGVYLIIRFDLVVDLSFYLLMISLSTMWMSSLSALFETDMKKIIALSTLSQLGVMMFSLSLGMKDLSFFHLISHAMFKSLIFLCAGAFIHFYINSQESRMMVKLPLFSSVMSVYFLFSNMSLVGVFFMTGFYSKDMILESNYMLLEKGFVTFLIVSSIILTLAYTFRLLTSLSYMLMKSSFILPNSPDDLIMYSPMFFLFILSITGGSMLSWTLFPISLNLMSVFPKIFIPVILSLMFAFFSMYYFNLYSSTFLLFFSKLWVLPTLTSIYSQISFRNISGLVLSMDQGWLEYFGAQNIYSTVNYFNFHLDKSVYFTLKLIFCFVFSLGLILSSV